MRRITATAVREFKATAMTKAFIIGTFIIPLVIWVVLIGAGTMGLSVRTRTRHRHYRDRGPNAG